MARSLRILALAFFAIRADAQPPGTQAIPRGLSVADAAQFEATLRTNANDRNARRALVDYYYLGGVNPADAIPARRRHIVWFIENAPADPVLRGSAATIDPAGHALADPLGFQRASAAWRTQTAKPDVSADALVNAAHFFKLSDKDFTISLLERAVSMEPSNKEFGARLGDEYALAIMGVTMINKNGFPLQADPQLTQSPAAMRAREALRTSANPYALAKAGYMMAWQGAILIATKKLAFDPSSLAKSAVERAVRLAPGEADVASYLEDYNQLQRQSGRGALAMMPQPGQAGVSQPQGPPATSASPQAAANSTPQPATSVDLSKITIGMSRAELLKLGPPAGRMSLSDGGHLMETYQYVVNGKVAAKIRLTDGMVSSVDLF
jgi:hypothetical protein